MAQPVREEIMMSKAVTSDAGACLVFMQMVAEDNIAPA